MSRHFQWIVHVVLLFAVPSTVLHPQVDVPSVVVCAPGSQQTQWSTSGFLSSYDNVLNLLDDFEDGEIEKQYSAADLEMINWTLAGLAAQGVLPHEFEEAFILHNDIQELLFEEDQVCQYAFASSGVNDYTIMYNTFGASGEVMLCKSWFKKKWEQTKKFIKKHKKAIIIGAAVVVAATVIVGVIAAASAGAAATGAAAATSDKTEKAQSDKSERSLDVSVENSKDASSVVNEAPSLQAVIDEHVSDFKEVVEEDNLLYLSEQSKGHEDAALGEKARNLGSALAHQVLDGISELTACVPQLLEEIKEVGHWLASESPDFVQDASATNFKDDFVHLVQDGHKTIDRVFATDLACLYTPEAKAVGEMFATGIIPFPGTWSNGAVSASKLAEAGKIVDRAGFTKAGRSLMKHGYREGSVFPKPTGNPTQVNVQGQSILESILNHPERKVLYKNTNNFGEVVDIHAPGIGGARFNSSGEMIGFLEP